LRKFLRFLRLTNGEQNGMLTEVWIIATLGVQELRCLYITKIFTYTLALHFQRNGSKLEKTSLTTDVVRGYCNILVIYEQLTFWSGKIHNCLWNIIA
jgi:hypothetical protein